MKEDFFLLSISLVQMEFQLVAHNYSDTSFLFFFHFTKPSHKSSTCQWKTFNSQNIFKPAIKLHINYFEKHDFSSKTFPWFRPHKYEDLLLFPFK